MRIEKKDIQHLTKDFNVIVSIFDDSAITINIFYKDWGLIRLTNYENSKNVMCISDLFVEDEFRNYKLGTKLITVCERIAKYYNCGLISLSVIKDSWMHKWYNKIGYDDFFTNYDNSEIITLIKKI